MSLISKLKKWIYRNIPDINITTPTYETKPNINTTKQIKNINTTSDNCNNEPNCYTTTPTALIIIQKWLKENNIEVEKLEEILHKIIGFKPEETIEIKELNLPVDSPLNTDGFLGTITFNLKENKYNKKIFNLSDKEIKDNIFNYIILFYKDYAILRTKIQIKKTINNWALWKETDKVNKHTLVKKINIFKDDKNEIQINKDDIGNELQIDINNIFLRYHKTYRRLTKPNIINITARIPINDNNPDYFEGYSNDKILLDDYYITIIPNTSSKIEIDDECFFNRLLLLDYFKEQREIDGLNYFTKSLSNVLEKIILYANINEDDCHQIKVSNQVSERTDLKTLDNIVHHEGIYTYDKTTGKKEIYLCNKIDPYQINYSIRNELNEKNSANGKIIEIIKQNTKLVITINADDNLIINNEKELRYFLINHILTENIDLVFDTIINILLQSPQTNYTKIEATFYENDKLIDKRKWINPNPIEKQKHKLVREKQQPKNI